MPQRIDGVAVDRCVFAPAEGTLVGSLDAVGVSKDRPRSRASLSPVCCTSQRLAHLAHLAPEAAVSHSCGMLGDQVSVELGYAVGGYLSIQVDDRQHAHRELAAAPGSVVLCLQSATLGDTPVVCVDALDDARPAKRLKAADVRLRAGRIWGYAGATEEARQHISRHVNSRIV